MTAPRGHWKLPELANRAGVSPRTVRYYVQRGLLPAPAFRGADTAYQEEHLLRLRAIRRLQERFFPLDAIQVELERLPPEAIRALAEGGEPSTLAAPKVPPLAPDSARAKVDAPAAWERWELAPGLELHLSQAADARSRAMAEKLREIAKPPRAGERTK
jgi:DNA-binding transcriptional MerR regulator